MKTANHTVSRTFAGPLAAVAWLAFVGYFVLVGGSAVGELHSVARLVTSTLGAVLIAIYVWRLAERADRIDSAVVAALILFSAAAVLSQFPRQSLDATLAALAYAAAFFVGREVLAEERWRTALLRVLITLSLVLTFIAVARWLPQVSEQSNLLQGIFPPLTLDLVAAPWGHRYDLVLAIAMLYPAWLVGRPSPLRVAAAVVMGLLVVFLVVITGSRTVWLAVALASVVAIGPLLRRIWIGAPNMGNFFLIGIVGLILLIIVSGVGPAVLERGLNADTLNYRTAMWSHLWDAWLTRPAAGYGPGAFPWLLQLTGYFDSNSLAPRHPDNAIIQLMVEGGVLGILAMLIVVVSVVPPIFRAGPTAARWVLVAFLVACVGGNPSDFGFVLAVVIAWAAYAIPRARRPEAQQREARRPMRVATLAALGVITIASVLLNVAAFSYDRARELVASGAYADARDALDRAVLLDPGMAIYVRERGALAYVTGRFGSAVADLRQATHLNQADDLAWRTLALAYRADGRNEAAAAALARAADLQRSDPPNLLLSARVLREEESPSMVAALLSEVVQAWPAVVAAPGWLDLLPYKVTSAHVVDAATFRWERGLPGPERVFDQPLWLVAMANRPDLGERAARESALGAVLGKALIQLTRCDPSAAATLDQTTEAERRHPLYPTLRYRASILGVESDAAPSDGTDMVKTMLNPLIESRYGSDGWGYRREGLSWSAGGDALPAPSSGLARWIHSPRAAVRAADLGDRLPGCR